MRIEIAAVSAPLNPNNRLRDGFVSSARARTKRERGSLIRFDVTKLWQWSRNKITCAGKRNINIPCAPFIKSACASHFHKKSIH